MDNGRQRADTASSRWARWGILIATLATAAALCATSWSSYARTRNTTQTLIRGDGELLFESATQYLRALRRPPNKKQLQTLLDKLSDRGVRYLEFHGPFAVVSVGERTYVDRPGPPQPGPPGRPIVFRRIGSIVRVEVRQPRPPEARQPGPPPPPRRFDGPPGPLGPPGPPRAPPLVMEFEPIDANALVAGARRSFVFSVATGGAMLAAALVAFVLLLRRERAEERLAQERHLASLGAMSAVLAHELRNPLASLKGHAQLLAESLPEDEKPRAKADRVVTEAVRLERLTSDLLAFVRTGKIDCKPVDPVAPLRAAVDEAGGDIEVDTAAAPERWSMDGDRIQQVLANLLRNAVQASPAGGSVHARVAGDKHHLLYEVRDHGDGIPSGEAHAIFEPFHTGRVKGTGLGLAVAKRVVELHGGSIDAHNHPDGGAVFRVRLPEGL